jgi:predicted RNA-binding Zn ribbon-like protein
MMDVAAATLYDRHGRWIPDGSWPDDRRAPGGLELVRRFLNTINRENDADLLSCGVAVAEWLTQEGRSDVHRVSKADAIAIRELRDLLHALVVSSDDSDAWTALHERASRSPLVIAFVPEPMLMPTGVGLQRFVGRMLIEVFEAQRHGTWPRLKACQHCMWTYYDHSKNQSAAWCAATACGGRARAKAYRARRRTQPQTR